MSRRRRGLIIVVILLGLPAIVLWWMTRIAPSWYAPPDPGNERVIELADRVEYNLVEQAHQIRPEDESWTKRIRDEQVNAWLSARLRDWVIHEGGADAWPKELGTPQIRFESEGISLALPLKHGSSTRTIVARLQPEMKDGRLRVQLDRVAMGRLAIPGEPLTALVNRINKSLPDLANNPQAKAIIEILSGRETVNPTFKLTDGRQIEIQDLRLAKGTLDFTARTVSAHRVQRDRRQ
jgi:hypothetical protein